MDDCVRELPDREEKLDLSRLLLSSLNQSGLSATSIDIIVLHLRRTKGSDVWQLFSTDKSPQLLHSACCMHCKVEVTYMKKSERVNSHLLKSLISVGELLKLCILHRLHCVT
jgi:hypothetical protein